MALVLRVTKYKEDNMYIITKKQTRPSVEIPFYFEKNEISDEYKNYFQKKFVETGKIRLSSLTYSDDRLTITRVLTWESRDAFLEFTTDPFCYDTVIEPNRLYDIEHDITSDIEITKE